MTEVRTFQIADTFEATELAANGRWGNKNVDLSAPLPLGHVMALERAIQLRNSNPKAYTYPMIAQVMGDYHGFWRSAGWWQKHCVESGRVRRYPRGGAYVAGAPQRTRAKRLMVA